MNKKAEKALIDVARFFADPKTYVKERHVHGGIGGWCSPYDHDRVRVEGDINAGTAKFASRKATEALELLR